jgi:hypothetical protein
MCYTKASKKRFLVTQPYVAGIMRVHEGFLIAVICLFLGFIATISLAQKAQDQFPIVDAGAGVDLVVTSVSGPATAIHNQTISVTYKVKNQGTVALGAYNMGLYLSIDKTIDPAEDRLGACLGIVISSWR